MGDKSQSFRDIFDSNRARIAFRAMEQWRVLGAPDPKTYRFVVDSTNYVDGGGFVNNG